MLVILVSLNTEEGRGRKNSSDLLRGHVVPCPEHLSPPKGDSNTSCTILYVLDQADAKFVMSGQK